MSKQKRTKKERETIIGCSFSMVALLLILGLIAYACNQESASDKGTQSALSVSSTENSLTGHKATPYVATNPNTSSNSALSYAQKVIRQKFADDAEFQSEGTIIDKTDVPNRYKILQKFTSENNPSGYTKFVYRIWVQKFDTGWDFGNLQIESIVGTKVLILNGDMKKKEALDGVGTTVIAGGITFTVAEKKSSAIRLYTKNKLSRSQLKSAILDLMHQYSTIQFATSSKHNRGDEYAAWINNTFFDFISDDVIGKENFFK